MLTVKIRFISLSLALTLPLVFSAAKAAENGGILDRQDTRSTQRSVLQENGVNNLTSTQQPRIGRRQASSIASDSYEGRVLSIRMDNNNWRVRMDREGTVFNVFVNASSGRVSSSAD